MENIVPCASWFVILFYITSLWYKYVSVYCAKIELELNICGWNKRKMVSSVLFEFLLSLLIAYSDGFVILFEILKFNLTTYCNQVKHVRESMVELQQHYLNKKNLLYKWCNVKRLRGFRSDTHKKWMKNWTF